MEAEGTPALAKAVTIALKADRNAAIDEATASVMAELAGTADAPGAFAGREKEIKEAMRSLTKKLVRKRVVERRRPHRRPWRPTTCGRCRPRWACCPRRTARACSSGARPRC